MKPIDPEWEVTVQDVKAKLDRAEDVFLLDVREPDEHAIVNIDGAQLTPLGNLRTALPELQPHASRTVITFCHRGGRSLQAAHFLRSQGFTDVKSMAGGIDAWAVHVDPSKPRY